MCPNSFAHFAELVVDIHLILARTHNGTKEVNSSLLYHCLLNYYDLGRLLQVMAYVDVQGSSTNEMLCD